MVLFKISLNYILLNSLGGLMHWVDVIAGELLKRGGKHVVASGTSISGQIDRKSVV